MPEVKLVCSYCDHKFKVWIWSDTKLDMMKCEKCSDHNLKVVTPTDLYGYEDQSPRPDAYVKIRKKE